MRSTPAAIAGGFALGTFIAFTPIIGLQMVLAVILSTLFNCNRPAAILAIWITNPVTIAPIFTINYWIGQKMWGGPMVSEVSGLFIDIGMTMAKLDIWEFKELITSVLSLGPDLIIPLCLGSLVVSTISAIIVYFPMLQLLYFLAERKKRKKTDRK